MYMDEGDYLPINDEGLAKYIGHEVEIGGFGSFVLSRSPHGIYRLDNPPGSPVESMELQGGEVLQVMEGCKPRKFRYDPACAIEASDGLNETKLWDLLRLVKPVQAEFQSGKRTCLFDVDYMPHIGFVVRHGEDSHKSLPNSSRVFACGREYRVAYKNNGLLSWDVEGDWPGNGTGSPDVLDEEDLMTLMLIGTKAALDGVRGKISFDFRKDNFCITDRSGSKYNLYDGAEITVYEGRSRNSHGSAHRCLLRLSGSEELREAVCLR